VCDLVPQHTGELVLLVEECQQSPGHVDVTARECEGVGVGGVGDVEVVGEVLPRRVGRQSLSDVLHPAQELGIRHEPHARLDLARLLDPDLDLALVGDQHHLGAPRDGVYRAGEQR
jgi:hypothetical protein